MSDNVVIFPKLKKDTLPQTKEEITSKVAEKRTEYARMVAEDLSFGVVEKILKEGMSFDDPKVAANLMLMFGVIESICMRCIGQEHEVSDLADNVVEINDHRALIDEVLDYLSEEIP